MKTRFSVLIPTFNREDCLAATIDSVLAQTFPDYELIVIDDGSTDSTRELLDSYGSRIKVIRQKQSGPEVARNAAAAQAEGEYLALLDSDDLFLPCALATYDRVIREFDSPAVVIGSMRYFSSEKPLSANNGTDRIEVLKYRDFFSKEVRIGMSSSRIVVRRSVFEQAGGLRNSNPETFHADDFNLLLRTGASGPFIVVQQPTTVAYRHHATNSIHNTQSMLRGVMALVHAELRGEYPGGRARQFERRARIGGSAQYWFQWGLKHHQPALAFELLKASWPMLLASAICKVKHQLRPQSSTIVLPAPDREQRTELPRALASSELRDVHSRSAPAWKADSVL